MRRYLNTLSLLGVLFMSARALALGIPEGFTQEKIKLGDVTLNVYKGGKGDPLLLLHGYAQSALMWAPVMERMKGKFTVIVPDLRGAGDSEMTAGGYDKVTLAEDAKRLLDHFGIKKARVVGHDVGLMVAYALAAKHPEAVEKLAVMDAFVPGVGPGDAVYNSPDIWHFRFHGPYAEKLVKGREYVFLDALWDGFSARKGSFPESDKKYYAEQYARPGRMRAGFGWFSSMPKDAADNKELAKTPLKMPVLSLGGEKSLGKELGETMKAVSPGARVEIVKGCGHWMLEECPEETLAALNRFL